MYGTYSIYTQCMISISIEVEPHRLDLHIHVNVWYTHSIYHVCTDVT
jgi:hypothetical protein